MGIAICRRDAGLAREEPIATHSQALAIAETALVEGAVGVTELPWELDVGRSILKLT
jgi:hypothetical protein